MILYHGTNKAFDVIDLTKSKPNKDFGQGFYLSREYSQAMTMAKTKVEQLKEGSPTVLTFEVNEEQMNRLKVLRFDDYTFEWAKFILMNRRNESPKPMHDFDIVFGPIANDRVGVQLWKFENKMIAPETFTRNLQRMEGITFQYFFGTERAIRLLKKL
ncbi:MAG: DUF3990 domain-containing protein [Paludibacteraceae bacterium]|nr:DUF3990 domain-containing protein [Paludibacteraceae bacterium]